MEQIRVFKGSIDDHVGNYFHSNLLIYKRHIQPKVLNEVLCVSIIGYPTDVKELDCANRKIVISHQVKGSHIDTFVIPNTDDYNTRIEKRGEFVELIFERKVDTMIRKEEEHKNENEKKEQAYPLLFIRNNNEEIQKTRLYKMVKNGVTTPMFPNVEEHLILAGQMFVDKKEAKEILDVLYGRSAEVIDQALLERAKYLVQTYRQWKEYLFTEMKKANLVRPVQVRYSPSSVQVYEVVIQEESVRKIVQDGVRKGQLQFTESAHFKTKINDFNEYMRIFAPAMAKRIDSLAKPLHRRGDIRPEVEHWFTQLQRSPISAQKDAIEASIKAMQLKGKVNMIGECGVGSAERSTITAA